MADQPSALHATRVRLSSHGQRWTGPLAAAQAAAHAHSGFSLLPVWKGSSFERPCGNFLRLAAHGSRSCAIRPFDPLTPTRLNSGRRYADLEQTTDLAALLWQ